MGYKKIRDIPAWIHGLWDGWGDVQRVGGIEAWLAMFSDVGETVPGIRSIGKRPSLQERALYVLDERMRDYRKICTVYETLLDEKEQTAIYYRHVKHRDWAEIPGLPAATAWRKGLSASEKLMNHLEGLREHKGDDKALIAAVIYKRTRRIRAMLA